MLSNRLSLSLNVNKKLILNLLKANNLHKYIKK